MKMLVLLLVGFLPLSLSARCDVSEQDSKYPKTGWRVSKCGFTITNAPTEEGELSLLECGERCEQVNGCRGFYYTFENQDCKLQGKGKVKRRRSSSTVFYKQANQLSSPIAFVAKLTSSVTGEGHRIYFDDVVMNLGNAYNKDDGTFVAPVNGLYEFSLKACSIGNHHIVLELMVNNNYVDRVLAGDQSYSDCSSTTLPVHLAAGDDVYVQQGPEGNYLLATAKYGLPQFNGKLIQAD